ncbi:MAG: hypothetical protein L0I61_09170, partial [Lactococcus lactis]|nr:hypothetical protein [Lactococcus lactis]MDN6548181.1 hypothetical protein [Lactococcus lactis]
MAENVIISIETPPFIYTIYYIIACYDMQRYSTLPYPLYKRTAPVVKQTNEAPIKATQNKNRFT